MRIRLLTVGILMAGLALVLAGCGGGDNGPSDTAPRVAVVVTPNPVVGGTEATFDLSGTTDSDNALSTLQYRIDYEGNGTYTAWTAWPAGGTVAHTYAAVATARTVNAKVQVRDPSGQVGEKAVAVTINPAGGGNQPPNVAVVVTPNPVVGGTAATFNMSGTADPDNAQATLQYRIDYEGNGTFTDWAAWPAGGTVAHTYAAVAVARTVNAKVQVRDPAGLVGEKVVAVTINPAGGGDQPPVGAFTITPTTGNTEATFQFDPSASTDVEEPNNVQVRFNFGDLTPVTAWAPKATVITHQYMVPGTYTVTMNVKDNAGTGTDVVKTVVVSTVTPPAAYRSFSAFGYTAGQPITVTVRAIPAAATAAYAVEDTPPTGWVATNISDGGTWDAVNGKVKWGPFFDNTARSLTYQVTPAAGTTGAKTFSGVLSADGASIAIRGVQTITNQ